MVEPRPMPSPEDAEIEPEVPECRDAVNGAPPKTERPVRPFRLVKYFSITGFLVILVFTVGLSLLITQQAKDLVLQEGEEYVLLLADNLNHQVFIQFVVPTALRYGRIRLRDEQQYHRLDAVVLNTIHGFDVGRVNIYDVEGSVIYSTDKDFVGTTVTEMKSYVAAVKGESSSSLVVTPSKGLAGLKRTYALRTFFPFRGEKPVEGPVGEVLGVFEIYQDLTGEYNTVNQFRYGSIFISLLVSTIVFVILRQILSRGEKIIAQRTEEQRRLEEKLHHAERLATLGQMTAVVSHEIRNPLGIISSTAEILRDKIRKYEPNNSLAGVIVEESRRLDGIVTEFLDFARPPTPDVRACQVRDIMAENLVFLEPDLEKHGITVKTDYQADLEIQADPNLLYRAFLNVLINAVQAMPDGGVLTVATFLPYGADGKSLGVLETQVMDTGAGIDPDQVDSVFNPFFTTKNRGSGLGLPIVKNIIEGHNGSVSIERLEEKGTRVIIRLPVSRE